MWFLIILSLGSPALPVDGEVTISWYGDWFDGRLTACGMIYDEYAMTCAHKTLPIGTIVKFYYEDREITLIVNDRGPYVGGRDFDFSKGAFVKLFTKIDIGVIGEIKYSIVGRIILPEMRYNL